MRPLFVLLTLPALWLGCSSSGELSCPEGSTGTPGACLVSCTRADQCLLDEKCVQGACQPISATDPVELTFVRAVPAVLPEGGGMVELEVVAINASAVNVSADQPTAFEPFVSTTTLGRIPLGMITESLSVSVQASKDENFSRTLDVEITVDPTIQGPEIKSFTSNPVALNAPGSITVRAEFDNAETATILRNEVQFYGDVTSPFEFTDNLGFTTTYRLVVEGAGGQTAQASLTVPVGDVPPLMVAYDFQVEAPNVSRPGDVAHIRWMQTEGPAVDGLTVRVRRGGMILAERSLDPSSWAQGTGSIKLPGSNGDYTLELEAALRGQPISVGSIEGIVFPRLRLEILEAGITPMTRFVPRAGEVNFVWDTDTGLALEASVFLRLGEGAAVSLPARGQQMFTVGEPTNLVLGTSAERRAYGYALDRALPITQQINTAGGVSLNLSNGGATGALPSGGSHSFFLPVNDRDSVFVQLGGDCGALRLTATDPRGNFYQAPAGPNGCPSIDGEVAQGTGDLQVDVSANAAQGPTYTILGWRRSQQSHLVFSDRYESMGIMQAPFRPLDTQLQAVNLRAATASVDVLIPFEFPFYGGRHRSVTIHRDGFVGFGSTPDRILSYDNTREPAIAVFGGPLLISDAGQISTAAAEFNGQQYLVIDYRGLATTDSNGIVSGQVFLREDGHVFVSSDEMPVDDGQTWWAGIRGTGQQATRGHPACADTSLCSSTDLRASAVHYAPYDRPPDDL